MVDGVAQKQSAAIGRIAQNAEAAGITTDQLQKLLKDVTFETGLFGKMAPQEVKDVFAGAALALARKQDPSLQALGPPKSAANVRKAVIESATTAAAMLDLFKLVFAGKDIAGQTLDAYRDSGARSGVNESFELLCAAAPKQLPMAEAKLFVAGLFDAIIAHAKTGKLSVEREVMGTVLSSLRHDLQKRGFSDVDGDALAAKGKQLAQAVNGVDMRNPDGKIALPQFGEDNSWAVLGYDIGWKKKDR